MMLDTIETVKDVLGRWGKKMGEAAKKTEDLAGNVWQHCEYFLLFRCVYEKQYELALLIKFRILRV